MKFISLAVFILSIEQSLAYAHTSNQALVMLLPTNYYLFAGFVSLVATIIILISPQLRNRLNLFASRKILRISGDEQLKQRISLVSIFSLVSFFLMLFLVYCGLMGVRDPLTNPLPLAIWTWWWIVILLLHSVIGNFWCALNPWIGPYRVYCTLFRKGNHDALHHLPDKVDFIPAIVLFLGFASLLLAYPAPEDPEVLAYIVLSYWAFTFMGMVIFGETWLQKCDFMSALAQLYSYISLVGLRDGKFFIGFFCWKFGHLSISIPQAFFILVVLSSSSFDGFNETYIWLQILDINPLAFPGRSLIIWETIWGLLLFNLLLISIICLITWLGLVLIQKTDQFCVVLPMVALSLIPIAVAYHFAHYLPVLLMKAQYSLVGFSDPLNIGANLFHLHHFHVSEGMFKSFYWVNIIFISMTITVTTGHMLSLVATHFTMKTALKDDYLAFTSQIPMMFFMLCYTLFGLWLLAAPRGI